MEIPGSARLLISIATKTTFDRSLCLRAALLFTGNEPKAKLSKSRSFEIPGPYCDDRQIRGTWGARAPRVLATPNAFGVANLSSLFKFDLPHSARNFVSARARALPRPCRARQPVIAVTVVLHSSLSLH